MNQPQLDAAYIVVVIGLCIGLAVALSIILAQRITIRHQYRLVRDLRSALEPFADYSVSYRAWIHRGHTMQDEKPPHEVTHRWHPPQLPHPPPEVTVGEQIMIRVLRAGDWFNARRAYDDSLENVHG